MKRYAVEFNEYGHWKRAAIYPTRKEAESYALFALAEWATRIVLCCR